MFGQAFGEQDSHIVSALNEGSPRELAISIYPYNSEQWIIQEKARITELLGENKLRFFDSTTHPLGDAKLKIEKPPTQG